MRAGFIVRKRGRLENLWFIFFKSDYLEEMETHLGSYILCGRGVACDIADGIDRVDRTW